MSARAGELTNANALISAAKRSHAHRGDVLRTIEVGYRPCETHARSLDRPKTDSFPGTGGAWRSGKGLRRASALEVEAKVPLQMPSTPRRRTEATGAYFTWIGEI